MLDKWLKLYKLKDTPLGSNADGERRLKGERSEVDSCN